MPGQDGGSVKRSSACAERGGHKSKTRYVNAIASSGDDVTGEQICPYTVLRNYDQPCLIGFCPNLLYLLPDDYWYAADNALFQPPSPGGPEGLRHDFEAFLRGEVSECTRSIRIGKVPDAATKRREWVAKTFTQRG